MTFLYATVGAIIAWYAIPYLIKKLNQYLLWRRCRTRRVIFLTYDGDQSFTLSEKIIQLLGEYNAKATFFVLGHKLQAAWEVTDIFVQSGHEIGSHSYRHLIVAIRGFIHDKTS